MRAAPHISNFGVITITGLPELVEAISFHFFAVREGVGFDRLSQVGFWREGRHA